MGNEMQQNDITPTVKGYETAFLGLCNLLKDGKIGEDEFLILDIYSRMATGMKIEELLEQMSGRKLIIIQTDGIVTIKRV